MDSEVLLAAEGFHHGLRNGSDPHLDGRAIRDQVSNVAGDPALDVAHARWRRFDEWLVDLDPAIDLGAVEERVAERPRHPWIHLCDHQRRSTGRGQQIAYGDAERDIAVGRRG